MTRLQAKMRVWKFAAGILESRRPVLATHGGDLHDAEGLFEGDIAGHPCSEPDAERLFRAIDEVIAEFKKRAGLGGKDE